MNRRQFIASTSLAAAALAVPSTVRAADSRITLALVGGAHIHTPNFINLLKGRADVRVKSVWDHDAARAAKCAQALGAAVEPNLSAIWNDAEIAGAVVCAETNRHRDLVLAGAAAKKHLFVEKPLEITARDSRAMADAMDRAGILFTTGYFMRTDPIHQFLRQEVQAGQFGKITRVRGSNCHSGSLGGWFDTEWRWMADPKQSGVGGFGDLGTHKLDILMWLFGEVESVTGTIQVVTERYGKCDESGEALLRFTNGITGTLAAGWVDVDDPVQLLISGTEAHAVVVNGQLLYKNKKVAGADGKTPFTNLPKALRAPMHQWVDAIAGVPNQQLVKPREAADRVKVMETIYKAAQRKTWVKV